MQYIRIDDVVCGFCDGGLAFLLDVRPGIDNLEGRFAQNGIQVPRTGRWLVLPSGLIEASHVAEIGKLSSVLPTLFLGLRRDRPVVQVIGA